MLSPFHVKIGNLLLDIDDTENTGHSLGDDGSKRGTDDAHIENENEGKIKRYIDHRGYDEKYYRSL